MDWRRRLSRFPLGGIIIFVVGVLAAIILSTVNFGAGLGHVDVGMLSGSPGGNYSAVVDRMAARAAKRGGKIENISTRGSVENVQRLVEGASSCDVHFALVQEGTPFPNPDDVEKLELIGLLGRSETVFLIGKDASKLTRFEELRGKKIGTGPKGSGTDHIARSIFGADDLKPLGLQLANHELAQQVELLVTGALDLGVFVMDDDAALIKNAIRDRGLELVSLEHLDVIPTRVPYLSTGTIVAGRYDALKLIPAKNHTVLRVATLVIGNRCASRSVEIGLLRVLVEESPGFAAKEGRGSLQRSAVAKEFLATGPGFADEYVPWLVDIMPLGNWFYIVMVVSVLFNAMTGIHKVRLWRIDANRDKAFQIVRDALGEKLTIGEIATLEPTADHQKHVAQIDAAIRDLDALRVKTRKQENAISVPMGAEWMYRYEEEQMELLLTSLRIFRSKLG